MRSVLVTLTLSVVACRNPDPQQENPDPSTSIGALDKVSGLGNGSLTAVAAQGSTVFVGSDHGLFRAGESADALALVAGDHAANALVTAVGTVGHQLFVAAYLDPVRGGVVLRSEDGGATFVSASAGLDVAYLWDSHAQFASDGERLVFAVNATLFEWDGVAWNELDTGDLFPDRVAMDRSLIVLDDAYGQGVFQENAATGTFEHVDSLDAWGYTAFAFDGDVAVTANSPNLFVREGDEWSEVFEDQAEFGHPAMDLLAKDGVVLAAGDAALRRSVDGGAFEDVAAIGSLSDEALAVGDDSLLWISDALRFSTDGGATWKANPSEIGIANQIAVGGGHTYALQTNQTWRALDAGQSSGFTDLAGAWPRGVAATDDEAWTCGDDTCSHAPHGAELVESDAPYVGGVWLGRRLFATRDAAYYTRIGVPCTDGFDPFALWRWDGAGWQELAGDGLPTADDVDCYAAGDGLLRIDRWMDAGDLLFVGMAGLGTYRSLDGGEHWEAVGIDLSAAATCAGGVLAITADGDLARSTDEGTTFEPLSLGDVAQGAVAVAAAGEQCVIGLDRYDGAPTLLAWDPQGGVSAVDGDFHEPVREIAADDAEIAVSTGSLGVFRAPILAD